MDSNKRISDIHSLKARSADNKVRHRAQSVIVEDKELVNVHDALHDTMEAVRKRNEWSSVIPEILLGMHYGFRGIHVCCAVLVRLYMVECSVQLSYSDIPLFPGNEEPYWV